MTDEASRLLVVDDDGLNRDLMVRRLSKRGYLATDADGGKNALEWIRSNNVDLVLLDVEMPGISGFEICRLIRRLPGYEKVPVVYLTSHDDFDSRQSGIASGGDDLISKPILPLELAVKVVTHLLRR